MIARAKARCAALPAFWWDAAAAGGIAVAALLSAAPFAVVVVGIIGWTCAWVSRDGAW